MPEVRDFDVETVDTDSPAPVAHALKGTEFPTDKEGLLEQARENGARDDVIEKIENMPEGEYQSMADVFEGVGEANRAQGGTEDDEENSRDDSQNEEGDDSE